MKFADFVCEQAVLCELQANDRDSAIRELVESLCKAGQLGNGSGAKIAEDVIKRESQASTGLGKGVAVPHIKSDAVDKVIAAVGLSGGGIDFCSLDKQPVYSVILLVSPSGQPDEHLQAMENVFKHLQNEKFRKFLRQSQSCAQVMELFKEADSGIYV